MTEGGSMGRKMHECTGLLGDRGASHFPPKRPRDMIVQKEKSVSSD